MIADIFQSLGRSVLSLVDEVGRVGIFFVRSVTQGLQRPYALSVLRIQALEIGFFSLPIVALTNLFAGMVLALQVIYSMSNVSSSSVVAIITGKGMVRELGPVLTALMVSGRIGSAMAAEIASMRVSEQISALIVLSRSPYSYLIFPRILLSVVFLPLLVLCGDILGLMGGYVVAVFQGGYTSDGYLLSTVQNLGMGDVGVSLLKGVVFGLIFSLMGCYHGFYAKEGSSGVGRASINAVVWASVLILSFDYILTSATVNW